jgi:hypothetical protein
MFPKCLGKLHFRMFLVIAPSKPAYKSDHYYCRETAAAPDHVMVVRWRRPPCTPRWEGRLFLCREAARNLCSI